MWMHNPLPEMRLIAENPEECKFEGRKDESIAESDYAICKNLYKKYPESLKLVHTLPVLFTLGVAFLLLASMFWGGSLSLLVLFALIVCVDSSLQNKSFKIGLLSIAASFIQLIGYGTGFLRAWWKRCLFGKREFAAFEKNFYQ